jgi:hypothetical protein
METACAQATTVKASLGTAYDPMILDGYIEANRACGKAHGTIFKAEEALKAAEAYGNQPASWKNLFGLLKTANGPSTVQQIQNAQLDFHTAQEAALTACKQSATTYQAVEALKAQVAAHAAEAAAAQATMARTAPIIEDLKARLGAAAFTLKTLVGIPVIGMSNALVKFAGYGLNKVATVTGLTEASVKNWIDSRRKSNRNRK